METSDNGRTPCIDAHIAETSSDGFPACLGKAGSRCYRSPPTWRPLLPLYVDSTTCRTNLESREKDPARRGQGEGWKDIKRRCKRDGWSGKIARVTSPLSLSLSLARAYKIFMYVQSYTFHDTSIVGGSLGHSR